MCSWIAALTRLAIVSALLRSELERVDLPLERLLVEDADRLHEHGHVAALDVHVEQLLDAVLVLPIDLSA